ncbi:B-BOX ZINC FINGER PROTEIN 18 [Salix koriyanagi]|uniref:B-BOX ZINC FINGER PROTEIN 18 n=1 Tax=Salix koriyanagi TaxID=2511006 RepID=A0A9Q1AMA4_9ROSI|nr:B-BOX ZINC FINGER PROTEIN 18 [Salix koriyanagi]
MKIQCNVCEAAEANVLCCADEAALCWACDDKVHAANKLASKHQRVPLSTSSPQIPKCDICQEAAGFFFCLEDRALLCRKCDVAIHTANTHTSAHQRFLLTGVKVGLEPTDPGASSSSGKSPPRGKNNLGSEIMSCFLEEACQCLWLVHVIKFCLQMFVELENLGRQSCPILEAQHLPAFHSGKWMNFSNCLSLINIMAI